MIEANRASSSAKLVSISTAVWGRAARMSRVASIPEPSERRTSLTTTSGRAWAGTAPPGACAGERELDAAADARVIVTKQAPQGRSAHAPILPAPEPVPLTPAGQG